MEELQDILGNMGKYPMPTLFRSGPYRVYIYASDGNEPKHVHVQRGDRVAKLWIMPVRVARSGGFSQNELRAIARIIRKQQGNIEKLWDEFFGISKD